MSMTQWKVWFRSESPDEYQHDEVEFAIEFRVSQRSSCEAYPGELVRDVARDLSKKLGIAMTGEIDDLNEI